jgi:hypothetical protein
MSDFHLDLSQKTSPQPFRFTLRQLLAFLVACSVGCFVLFCILMPAIRSASQADLRMRCNNNLKQISVALYTYCDVNGCFPPPFVTDSTGKPTHSWRRLILPYLDSHPLGVVWPIDLDEAWDSPKNLAAAKRFVPPCYFCPAGNQAPGSGITNYVMIVGEATAAPSDRTVSPQDITAGTARTIIVAEIADSDILWSEPRDLLFDQMSFRINDDSKPSISSRHVYGAFVVFVDGHTEFLDNSLDPGRLKALLIRSANQRAEAPGE